MPDTTQPYVLVTGGAGFMGAHLVRAILADDRYSGFHVIAMDDLSGGFLENLPDDERLTFLQASVTDSVAVAELFERHKIRYVFHLAAYAAEGLSHFIRRFNYENNLIGSVNLINAAVKYDIKHFVFTSSIAVYGGAQVPMTEETVPLPEDPYGIAKLAVEMDLACANEMFGLTFTVFRPHNVYGEYQNIGDRYRNVVGIFMNRILQGQTLPVFGDGSQQRAFTYIDDLLPAFLSAPFVDAAANQVFNVGAQAVTSVNELAEVVSKEFGVEPQLEHLPARNEVHQAWSDHSKALRVFGALEETSLEDGIGKMARWVKQVGARKSKSFDQIEIRQGLPPSWASASG